MRYSLAARARFSPKARLYSTEPRSSQCPSITTFVPEFDSRYLPSLSRAALASCRSEKSSKSKNASSSDSFSPVSLEGGGGGVVSEGGGGVVVSVGGGSSCPWVLTFFLEAQPGATASTIASPSNVADAILGVRRIQCLPSVSGSWTTTTSRTFANLSQPPGSVNPNRP